MRMAEIVVDRIERNGIIVGTNNAGEVPLGTLFTQLAKISLGAASMAGQAVAVMSAPVKLRLTDAIIYRKSVAVIPAGWGVGMVLEGEGRKALEDALLDRLSHEHILLRTTEAS